MEGIRKFFRRADFYASTRPRYPAALFDDLIRDGPIPPGAVIVDVGSGTGISAEPFLERGYTVIGVEPNPEMRAKAESLLGRFPAFRSVDGTAEATTLAAASADVVMAATAFHWFDPVCAGAEFRRILRSPGLAVLMWNTRLSRATAFTRAFEEFVCRWGKDYRSRWGGRDNPDGSPELLFGEQGFHRRSYPHRQSLDADALLERWLSASYAPLPAEPGFPEMVDQLQTLFKAFQQGGLVELVYEARVYWGRLR